MLDRLQAAFTRQKQFTADASHELRTPLTIIDLETSRMLSNRRSADEYERVLRTIQSENKFMIRLVTNLLALARMDAGQMSLKFEPIDLGGLVSEVIERMELLAKAQGVRLVIGELPDLSITGDHSTLTQMLTNLVENAIKYSAGGADPQVDVSAGRREEAERALAWVRVEDNGIGIAAEHIPQLFDRFYQADASRTRRGGAEGETNEPESSGTGLGLAIAQWIAHAHHGEIRIESVLGQGSTFEVILPASNTSD
jgi:signal transduction histidine kinase